MGFDIKIEGLEKLQGKFERLPEDIKLETEGMLREAANRIVFAAQTKCPDPTLREKITSEVTRSNGDIIVNISAPPEARGYLREAYEENENTIRNLVADAIRSAIER